MSNFFTSPNKCIKGGEGKIHPYELGQNQLALRFKNRAFAILLNPDYYEGTEYGQYYNAVEKGKSSIYVEQPITEKALEVFLRSDSNSIKYLVGYTGVGKTTVIRNFFGIFNRNIKIVNKDLIIYHSFFSTSSTLNDSPKDGIWDDYRNTIAKTITHISGMNEEELLFSQDTNFYKEFYEFMKENNPNLANSYPRTPKFRKKLTKNNFYEIVIEHISKKYEIDYYLMQLKYYINLYQKNNTESIENVVFIFDDIEAQKVEYHEKAIELAYHLKKCISAYKNKTFDIKILIALRNYAFRLNQERQKAAFREIDNADIILKEEVPKLSEVIIKRTESIINNPKTIEGIVELDSWKTASNSLIVILKKLYGNYDEILLNLTHYNIFNSMTLLLRILTNRRYLGKHEVYGKEGAFVIDPKVYDVSNKNSKVITNNTVFNSLVYGEGEHYFDCGDFYLPNVLHYSKEERVHSRVLKLFILRYFCISQESGKNTLYGLEFEKGCDVINRIYRAFRDAKNNNFKKDIKEDLKSAIAYLYSGGVLLQSIKDVEHREDTRKYHDDDYLYLSLRGSQIISMLESNALLFEVYRNDIDTDLENNDISSVNLSKEASLLYCLKYAKQLFESEIYYINQISDTDEYFSMFGNDYIVTPLIKGLQESINIFYSLSVERYKNLKEELIALINYINSKTDFLKKEKNMEFNIIEV